MMSRLNCLAESPRFIVRPDLFLVRYAWLVKWRARSRSLSSMPDLVDNWFVAYAERLVVWGDNRYPLYRHIGFHGYLSEHRTLMRYRFFDPLKKRKRGGRSR